jgi:hypothetical protein
MDLEARLGKEAKVDPQGPCRQHRIQVFILNTVGTTQWFRWEPCDTGVRGP